MVLVLLDRKVWKNPNHHLGWVPLILIESGFETRRFEVPVTATLKEIIEEARDNAIHPELIEEVKVLAEVTSKLVKHQPGLLP